MATTYKRRKGSPLFSVDHLSIAASIYLIIERERSWLRGLNDIAVVAANANWPHPKTFRHRSLGVPAKEKLPEAVFYPPLRSP